MKQTRQFLNPSQTYLELKKKSETHLKPIYLKFKSIPLKARRAPKKLTLVHSYL